MIYKLRILSDENDQFLRMIEIEEDSTFLDLHFAIQSAVDFDDAQMASFYVSDKEFVKGTQITLMDMDDDDSDQNLSMSDTKLNEYVKSENDTLLYVYDFFSDRAFYIFLAEVKEVEDGVIYPVLTNSVGEAPEQVMYDDMDVEEFMGDDYYDDDEVKPRGKSKSSYDYDEEPDLDDLDDLDNLDSFNDDYDDGYDDNSYY